MTVPARLPVVLALGAAQTLAWGSTYYLPAILAQPMARDLGTTVDWVFGAFTAALVLSALLGPVAGRHIDRHGGRGILAASSLVFATGLALIASAQGLPQLFAGWLVIGVGMGSGLYEAAFSTLARIYGRDARSAITGITLLAGLASTICWPTTAWIEADFGWRTACWFWAGMHLVVGLPLNRLMVPDGGHAALPDAPGTGEPAPVRPLTLWLLGFVFAATWFNSTAMAAHLPRLLQDAGATPAAAIAAAALIGPAQVAGRLFEFGLMRRLHPLVSARIAAITHPLGAATLLVAGAPAAMLFTVLHGTGNGLLSIAKGTLPLVLFGPQGYGLRQGILTAPARFGQAAAPLLFAMAIERYGASALLLSSGLGLASFAALLALAPATSTRRA